MLSEAGCPFIWKGGSSLMLILGSSLHRLSIDVDIVCPPGTDIESYIAKFHKYGFTGHETVERELRDTSVPKSHEKLHYRIAYLSRTDRTESILLDVLYEDAQYERVKTLKVESPFIRLDGEALTVKVPSVDDILADKLTAFAPNTSGIPYYKNGYPRFVEVIKQLYDVGRLFDKMTDLSTVRRVCFRIANIELAYKHLSNNPAVVFQDIRDTALCLATRGMAGRGDFEALQKGINFIRPFMYQSNYYIEDAIIDAAKAACLATAIEKGAESIQRYDCSKSDQILYPAISDKLYKLRGYLPEAFHYWAVTSKLLAFGEKA